MKKIYLRVTDADADNELFAASWSDTDGERFTDILSVFSEKKPLLHSDEKLSENYRNTINHERLSKGCFSFTVSPIYGMVSIYCVYRVDSPSGQRIYTILLCDV